jgi:hypothetical protein
MSDTVRHHGRTLEGASVTLEQHTLDIYAGNSFLMLPQMSNYTHVENMDNI